MSLSNDCMGGVYMKYHWQGGKVNLNWELQKWRRYVMPEAMAKIKEMVNEEIT